MKLAATISLHGGGVGSGCNPTKGKCGRPDMGKEEPQRLVGSGWFKDGKFYRNTSDAELHTDSAVRNGLASRSRDTKMNSVEREADIYKQAFQKGAVRISQYGNTSDLESWSKSSEDLREAISRLPETVKNVLVEWWSPKHDAEEYPDKEAAMNHLYASAKGKKK